jgi:hypothetical protein
MIVRGHVRRQQADGRQRHRSILERDENGGKAARRASRLDSVVRRALGEVQRLGAVRKQGRVTLAEIEPPHVDLHQRAHEGSRGATFRQRQTFHSCEELIIREPSE